METSEGAARHPAALEKENGLEWEGSERPTCRQEQPDEETGQDIDIRSPGGVHPPETYRIPSDDDRALFSDADFQFDVSGNEFAFTPGHLEKLLNPKSVSAFYALGGLSGLEKDLRSSGPDNTPRLPGDSRGSLPPLRESSPDDRFSFLLEFDTVYLMDVSDTIGGGGWKENDHAIKDIRPVCTHSDADDMCHTSLEQDDVPHYRKEHRCPIPDCGKLYSRMDTLKRHIETHKTAPKTHTHRFRAKDPQKRAFAQRNDAAKPLGELKRQIDAEDRVCAGERVAEKPTGRYPLMTTIWAGLALVSIGVAISSIARHPVLVFLANFLAIIPLAAVLSYFTEELAVQLREALHRLLDAHVATLWAALPAWSELSARSITTYVWWVPALGSWIQWVLERPVELSAGQRLAIRLLLFCVAFCVMCWTLQLHWVIYHYTQEGGTRSKHRVGRVSKHDVAAEEMKLFPWTHIRHHGGSRARNSHPLHDEEQNRPRNRRERRRAHSVSAGGPVDICHVGLKMHAFSKVRKASQLLTCWGTLHILSCIPLASAASPTSAAASRVDGSLSSICWVSGAVILGLALSYSIVQSLTPEAATQKVRIGVFSGWLVSCAVFIPAMLAKLRLLGPVTLLVAAILVMTGPCIVALAEDSARASDAILAFGTCAILVTLLAGHVALQLSAWFRRVADALAGTTGERLA